MAYLQKQIQIILITGISITCSHMAYSQTTSDTCSIKTIFSPESHATGYSKYVKDTESETQLLLSFSFLFYKEYISSQDVDACVFQPSCSVYTMEAIEKKGTIRGLLDGFDRLLRCHLFVNESDYQLDMETAKYHDPH